MKASEILRALADKIDSVEQPQQNSGTHRAELSPVEVDNTDHTEDSVYIAPLQQKLELLKKAAGVDSVYDEEGAEEQGEDDLTIMKRNAGVPVVMQIAGEDNDVLEDKQ